MSAARRLGAAARALGAALLTACASAVAQSGAGPASPVAAPQAAIAPGDVVRVRIWREPDLSGSSPWTRPARWSCRGWARWT